MGQNLAQPFIDWRDKLIGWAQKIGSYDRPVGRSADSPARPDTSWHDEMVRDANRSFLRQAEADRAAQAAAAAAKTPAKTPVKRNPKRVPTRAMLRSAASKRR